MKINYWACNFHDYDEGWDGERFYGCKHPDTESGICELENKYFNMEDECSLQKEEEHDTID